MPSPASSRCGSCRGVLCGLADQQVDSSPLGHIRRGAAVFVAGTSAVVAHVGDTRVYRLRAGELELLTVDHRIGRHVRSRCLGSSRPDVSAE